MWVSDVLGLDPIRAMPGDLEHARLPAPVSPAAPGTGPAVLAGELLARVRAELPVVGELGERSSSLPAGGHQGLPGDGQPDHGT